MIYCQVTSNQKKKRQKQSLKHPQLSLFVKILINENV